MSRRRRSIPSWWGSAQYHALIGGRETHHGDRHHEMSFARDVADRVIFMDHGRIVEQGPAKALFANPQHQRTQQFLDKFLNQ